MVLYNVNKNSWLKGEISVRNRIIILDPGHGGRDPGAVSMGINEKDLNLKIAAKLHFLLQNRGIKVKMTRTDDRYLFLGDRVRMANNLKADIFISIHCNASNSPRTNGIETLYYPESFKGKVLAEEIQLKLVDKLKRKDLGIKTRDDLFVLKYTSMPAVLIECGFLTNPEEKKLLTSDSYGNDIATAISSAASEYFEKLNRKEVRR
ncbi:MAG: N-acetylmuramoyl-L-alanine amidase [Firmicutes bacterium]|nr:N-acetylmuramoyl-L-alanine amidase [Bacillota bacterium]